MNEPEHLTKSLSLKCVEDTLDIQMHVSDWKYSAMKNRDHLLDHSAEFLLEARSAQAHWQHTRLEDQKKSSTLHHHVKVTEVKKYIHYLKFSYTYLWIIIF